MRNDQYISILISAPNRFMRCPAEAETRHSIPPSRGEKQIVKALRCLRERVDPRP
jgi:hypothetical protein